MFLIRNCVHILLVYYRYTQQRSTTFSIPTTILSLSPPPPQASVCTRTKPHVSNSTDFDKSKRIYNTETCIFSNKSFCANQKAQNFQNFRFKLNQEGAMSSPTFFNRTLKISQNARQKRISLPCFHAHTKARAFLPPPPLLHMLALKAHHPLSSDLRRIVVTRAKSHVTLLPFPLPPPHSAGMGHSPRRSSSSLPLTNIRTLSLDRAPRNPEIYGRVLPWKR